MCILSIPANLRANIFSSQNNVVHEPNCGSALPGKAARDRPVPTERMPVSYSNLPDVRKWLQPEKLSLLVQRERQRESMGANECGLLRT